MLSLSVLGNEEKVRVPASGACSWECTWIGKASAGFEAGGIPDSQEERRRKSKGKMSSRMPGVGKTQNPWACGVVESPGVELDSLSSSLVSLSLDPGFCTLPGYPSPTLGGTVSGPPAAAGARACAVPQRQHSTS